MLSLPQTISNEPFTSGYYSYPVSCACLHQAVCIALAVFITTKRKKLFCISLDELNILKTRCSQLTIPNGIFVCQSQLELRSCYGFQLKKLTSTHTFDGKKYFPFICRYYNGTAYELRMLSVCSTDHVIIPTLHEYIQTSASVSLQFIWMLESFSPHSVQGTRNFSHEFSLIRWWAAYRRTFTLVDVQISCERNN